MAHDLARWLNETVYTNIYTNADRLFPEFGFVKRGRNWVSTTPRKADGSSGTNPGKVQIWQERPGVIKDFRLDRSVTIWNYVKAKYGLTKGRDVIEHLAKLANVEPLAFARQSDSGPNRQHYGVRPKILQAALRYFQDRLEKDSRAGPVRAYLSGRGYSPAEIKAMGLGFLPSRRALRDHLLHAEHKPAQVAFFLRRLGLRDRPGSPDGPLARLDTTHQLTIPCRGLGQRLEGFSFRSLTGEGGDKYLNMAGLQKSVALLNFPAGGKELVVVEGIFDAAAARARGLGNVVPLNGTALDLQKAQAMMQSGIERLTLCLDNDKAGHKATRRIIKHLYGACPELSVFVGRLPSDSKDPDELMRHQGVEAFRRVIDHAVSAGAYLGSWHKARIDAYDAQALTPKKRDTILRYCRYVFELNG